MIELSATVVGAEQVAARLEAAGKAARASIRATVEGLGIELQRKVAEEKLGGQVLNVRTGRLRRSITQVTTVDGDTIVSRTGTNVSYGRFWELGFDGVEHVRPYVRSVASRSASGTIDGKRRKTAQGVAFVRAHDRQVHQAARPFLQPSLAEMRERIRDRLTAAVTEAIRVGQP